MCAYIYKCIILNVTLHTPSLAKNKIDISTQN